MNDQDMTFLATAAVLHTTDTLPFLDLPNAAVTTVAKLLTPTERLQLGREVLPRSSCAAAAVLETVTRLELQVPYGVPLTLPTKLQNLRDLVLEPLPVNPRTHQPHVYRKACKILGCPISHLERRADFQYVPDYDTAQRDDTALCHSLAHLTMLTGLTLVLPFSSEVDKHKGTFWTQNRLPGQSVSQVCLALGQLTNLRSLSAKYLNPSDDDVAQLSTLVNLESLDIGTHGRECGPEVIPHAYMHQTPEPGVMFYEPEAPHCSLTVGVSHVTKLSNLRRLSLEGHIEVVASGLQQLSGLTALTSLNLNKIPLGQAQVEAVAALLQSLLPRLVEFRMAAPIGGPLMLLHADARAAMGPIVAALEEGLCSQRLLVLDLTGRKVLRSMSRVIAQMTSLRQLCINDSSAWGDLQTEVHNISGVVSNLTGLVFGAAVFPAFTHTLIQASGLVRLQLHYAGLQSSNFAAICRSLTQLTALELETNPNAINLESCSSMSCLAGLKRLRLCDCWPDSTDAEFTTVLCGQLAGLLHLSHLSLWSASLSNIAVDGFDWDTMLGTLPSMANLKEVVLVRRNVEDWNLEALVNTICSLTQLQRLQLDSVRPGSSTDVLLDVELVKACLTSLTEFAYLNCETGYEF